MLNIKGKQHLWARCDKHGWLWKRTGRQGSWTRHWVVVKGSLLVIFPDDKVLPLFWRLPVVFAPPAASRNNFLASYYDADLYRRVSLQRLSDCTQTLL